MDIEITIKKSETTDIKKLWNSKDGLKNMMRLLVK